MGEAADQCNHMDSEIRPQISFSVCDDGDEVVHEDTTEDSADHLHASSKKLSLLMVSDTFQTLRRMSDSSMKQMKDKLKKVPNLLFKSPGSQHLVTPESGRKMSLDAGGILKNKEAESSTLALHPNAATAPSFGRKSVSFCTRDNVRVFEAWEGEHYDDDEDDSLDVDDLSLAQDPDDTDCSRGRSLVATFVYPGKRPTYAKDFDRNVIILESIDITEDLCVIGNIRVNMQKLMLMQLKMKSFKSSGRVSVGASYSMDQWQTKRETRAMLVKAQAHPALGGKDTRAMRFFIECDDIEAGQTIEFFIWCKDKFCPILSTAPLLSRGRHVHKSGATLIDVGASPVIKVYKEDNDGRNYKISCTPKLNVWAAKAAQELKNVSPIVKLNNVVAST